MYNFETKLKMNPLEESTFKEAINHETGFTGSQNQGYSKFTNNLQRQGNLIPKLKIEQKRGPRQTIQIDESSQGGNPSLDFVMLRGRQISSKIWTFKWVSKWKYK